MSLITSMSMCGMCVLCDTNDGTAMSNIYACPNTSQTQQLSGYRTNLVIHKVDIATRDYRII